ncbi:19762_t:CDS:2 [Racocetra fulgida]|uniref:19762_t:CDS:1 n=1 Tax=Racocetra fulgida TaxID=60492 RepID=A0A9N8ZPE7_9GLOM|nr:19762_t:CDS:2 [Racocetra fulgida]
MHTPPSRAGAPVTQNYGGISGYYPPQKGGYPKQTGYSQPTYSQPNAYPNMQGSHHYARQNSGYQGYPPTTPPPNQQSFSPITPPPNQQSFPPNTLSVNQQHANPQKPQSNEKPKSKHGLLNFKKF